MEPKRVDVREEDRLGIAVGGPCWALPEVQHHSRQSDPLEIQNARSELHFSRGPDSQSPRMNTHQRETLIQGKQ